MGDMPDDVQALYTSVKNTWQDAENLDGTHGYTSYIWIPEETFKVDKMKLRVYAEKFRAYSKSALAGGGQTKTSSSGGGQTKTSTYHSIPHTHDVVIGTKTSTSETAPHTHDVVIGAQTSTAEGAHRHKFGTFYGEAPPNVNSYISLTNWANQEIARMAIELLAAGSPLTEVSWVTHSHDIDYGTKTRASGEASHAHDVTIDDHTHDVTIDNHTHPIDFGIYEEDIAGRTLSATLYDPDGNVLKDFGVVLTGEDSDVLNLSEYFETLKYGMYRLVLSASNRLRARLVFYELCKMYAQY